MAPERRADVGLFRDRPVQTRSILRMLPRLSDSIIQMIARFVTMGCTAAVLAIASRVLNPEAFGIWTQVTAVATIVNSFDLGMANAVRNRLALEAGNDGREDFLVAAMFTLGLAVVYGAVVAVLYGEGILDILFKGKTAGIAELGAACLLVSVLVQLLRMPAFIALNAFFSFREARLNAFFETVGWLVVVLVTPTAFLAGFDLFGTVVLFQAMMVGSTVLALVTFLWRRRWSLELPHAPLERLRRLMRSAIPFGLLQLITMVGNYTPNFIVGAVVGVAEAGTFRAASTLYLATLALHLAYLNPLWTEFSYAVAEKRRTDVADLIRRGLLRTLVVLIPIAGVIVVGPSLLSVWIGGNVPVDRGVLLALGVWAFVVAIGNVVSIMLIGSGRPLGSALGALPGTLIAIPLAVVAADAYGVVGVCWSFVAVATINVAIIATIAVRNLSTLIAPVPSPS